MKIDIRLSNPNAHIETANGHRYAIDLHNIDLSHCDLLTTQEKTDTTATIAAAISGKVIDPYPDPPTPPTDLELWGTGRTKRTQLLHDTDWTVLADAPLTAAQKTAWEAYRQALRDIPATNSDPTKIVFPDAP